MLIITSQHKKEDLVLWNDYEEMDRINAQSDRLTAKEEKAVTAIAEFACRGGAYVGVSWGKDSVVVADLTLRHGINLPLIHLYCIPSHNKNCDLVKDVFLAVYPGTYREYICDYSDIYSQNLPPDMQDKETDKIWFNTWRKVEKDFPRHITGVRGKESRVRRIRMNRWGISTERTCAPIGYWTDTDVFAYLYKYRLPVHPNYGMLGGGRWQREWIRTAEIGDVHGTRMGRAEWEREYYPDILARIQKG